MPAIKLVLFFQSIHLYCSKILKYAKHVISPVSECSCFRLQPDSRYLENHCLQLFSGLPLIPKHFIHNVYLQKVFIRSKVGNKVVAYVRLCRISYYLKFLWLPTPQWSSPDFLEKGDIQRGGIQTYMHRCIPLVNWYHHTSHIFVPLYMLQSNCVIRHFAKCLKFPGISRNPWFT